MSYCPGCGVEYRPGFAECSDCHVALVDEPNAGGASRLDAVGGAADAVFAILYGIAGLFCFMMFFIIVAADPGPHSHPDDRPAGLWFAGGYLLLIVALFMVGLKSRRRPRA